MTNTAASTIDLHLHAVEGTWYFDSSHAVPRSVNLYSFFISIAPARQKNHDSQMSEEKQ